MVIGKLARSKASAGLALALAVAWVIVGVLGSARASTILGAICLVTLGVTLILKRRGK